MIPEQNYQDMNLELLKSDHIPIIHDDFWSYFEQAKVTPSELDTLLADGWRHFGTFFFRDKLSWNKEQLSLVIPLRINLDKFAHSKSQRKILRNNADLEVVYRPSFIDDQKERLFQLHCQRFTDNIPSSLNDFLSDNPAFVPCRNIECCLFLNRELLAVSFLDIGEESTSSVYAIFNPKASKRSLGIHTLLAEIQFSKKNNKKFLYTGYSFPEESPYDYKKKFHGTEYYTWQDSWKDLPMGIST